MSLIRKARLWLRDERGITGLETAIILIAFVVVATVFAFVVLTTGIFSAERGKETVYAGLAKARGTMEVRGGLVIADNDGSIVQTGITDGTVQFTVANTAGGDPIPLDPTATNNRTVIAYRDGTVIADDVPYSVNWVVSDGDALLENGELAVVTVNVADITGSVDVGGTPTPTGPATFEPNSRFTFEIQTPVGAVLDVTRSMPAQLDAVMQLH
ncbi:MAG TPA: archaellin/type IV pilin N-terminal domain-containing protein [Dehalococcoidia bacterium]|nr:archaellin/type IV pilin N-terminal domain-containing protein [Dehalococcoidia bacterium]